MTPPGPTDDCRVESVRAAQTCLSAKNESLWSRVESLVALDMQRILEEANASSLVFARSIVEAASLSSRFREWDLAIVECTARQPRAAWLLIEGTAGCWSRRGCNLS